jgi:uncharacterized secreted protein with C-terminal beta-propeller domain
MYRRIASTIILAVIIGSAPILLLTSLLTEPPIVLGSSTLQRFTSYNELFQFLNRSHTNPPYYYGPPIGTIARTFSALEADAGGKQAPDYSTTNIQVEGIDEADIIKSDGQYFYIVSSGVIYIVKAYPPEEASIASTIELNSTVLGIFVNEDKLVVFSQEHSAWRYDPEIVPVIQAQIKIYNVENRNDPILEDEITLDGYYFDSRKIGEHIYVVTNHPAYIRNDEVILPKITRNNETEEVEATDVYYSDAEDYYQSFTTIVSINMEMGEILHETVLVGYSANLYVSQDNIYMATPRYENGTQTTEIHRIRTDDGAITYEASGKVPGYVLNQF